MTNPAGQLTPAVVLVADRTLSADYKVLFEGIFATMQTTQAPAWAMRRFFAPTMPTDRAGRAMAAPVGLRRVEASLLAGTALTAGDVVCATPESLPKLLGPWTKIVGVHSSDPLGEGMSNTTSSAFCKGPLYTRLWTDRMMDAIGAAKARWGFRVVGGGGGAWQWARRPEEARRQGIDTVFEGFFESAGPALFESLLAGQAPPAGVREPTTAAENIRPIRGASLMGVVEMSRGCGNGCRYCTMAGKKMAHLPAETILADVATNVAAGVRSVVSSSEDFFRYGGTTRQLNFDALCGLLEQIRRIDGLRFMQIDHANISSVVQLSVEQLREVRRLLTWSAPSKYLWVNLGAESANGRLVEKMGRGKLGPFQADEWDEMVRTAADRLDEAGFFPVFSIILGLPGETAADVARTRELVRFLGERRAVIFPVFHEPLPTSRADGDERFTVDRMRPDQLDLFRACYEINFQRVPKLFWDNQRAGGVSWAKRMVLQMLGRMEVVMWRRRFVRLGRQISSRAAPVGTMNPANAAEDAVRVPDA
ncbi:MAG TPA: radical SAM protein [Phycisphaerae bacterium]|nr:radical SAM protein [Phycisphaerae bacterium]